MTMTTINDNHQGEVAPFAWIDAHIHLDLYPEAEREAMLDEAFDAGAAAVVAVSMNLASSRANRELAIRYPGRVMPAYGHHPERPLPSAEEEEELFRWIRERHAAGERFAIGEVGLPYYTRTETEADGKPFDEAPYVRMLDRFAALAAELDRPLVLHAVYEDAAKALELVLKHGVRRAHFHWFKGPEDTVRRMIAAGCRISVTPDIAYEAEIQALAAIYPLELTMAETDGPWPFEGPYDGRRTTPMLAADAVRRLAAVKGLGEAETAARLLAGTKGFYGLA